MGDLTPEQLKTAQEALVAAVEAVGYQAVAKALEVNTEIVEEELLLVGGLEDVGHEDMWACAAFFAWGVDFWTL